MTTSISRHTEYSNLTDEELIRVVCGLENPTDMEMEMMQRMENLIDQCQELIEMVSQCAVADADTEEQLAA